MWEKIKEFFKKTGKYIIAALLVIGGALTGFFVTRWLVKIGVIQGRKVAFEAVPGFPNKVKVETPVGSKIIQLPKDSKGRQVTFSDVKAVGVSMNTKEVTVEALHNVTDRRPHRD